MCNINHTPNEYATQVASLRVLHERLSIPSNWTATRLQEIEADLYALRPIAKSRLRGGQRRLMLGFIASLGKRIYRLSRTIGESGIGPDDYQLHRHVPSEARSIANQIRGVVRGVFKT